MCVCSLLISSYSGSLLPSIAAILALKSSIVRSLEAVSLLYHSDVLWDSAAEACNVTNSFLSLATLLFSSSNSDLSCSLLLVILSSWLPSFDKCVFIPAVETSSSSFSCSLRCRVAFSSVILRSECRSWLFKSSFSCSKNSSCDSSSATCLFACSHLFWRFCTSSMDSWELTSSWWFLFWSENKLVSRSLMRWRRRMTCCSFSFAFSLVFSQLFSKVGMRAFTSANSFSSSSLCADNPSLASTRSCIFHSDSCSSRSKASFCLSLISEESWFLENSCFRASSFAWSVLLEFSSFSNWLFFELSSSR